MEGKSIKQYAKEAKKRLKSGFWESRQSEIEECKIKAVSGAVAVSKVVEYYAEKNRRQTNGDGRDDEEFYQKVKAILDTEGETPGVIGKLTDKEYFQSLPYEKRQRYLMELSERYLKCLDRYNKEKAVELVLG
jgi:hypothetical protein